jgi:hypothetical protein
MAGIYANWIDGTAVCAQREGYFLSKTMGGKGATFRTHTAPGSKGEWFQWAIPTPVLVNSKRSFVKKVFVLYSTIGTAKLQAIHVYDSDKKIVGFDNLHYSGNHSSALDAHNSWTISSNHQMVFGLGISVLVDFGPASKVGVPGITFYSAGADFMVP